MERQRLYYLGPEGTFTHQAAIEAASRLNQQGVHRDYEFVACADVYEILEATQHGDGWGVIAWESNVEGFVVPNLDMMIDSTDVAGFSRISVDIAFDAFVTAATYNRAASKLAPAGASASEVNEFVLDSCTTAHAHSHGLAQCRTFTRQHDLTPESAPSNAAACRDLQDGQVAFGPSICGQLYDLKRVGVGVQDYASARTDFLVVAPRDTVFSLLEKPRETVDVDFESIIAFIPLVTGPGVVANLLDLMRDTGLNMSSFMSRPIKGHDGTYSFFATYDCAPWQPAFVDTFTEIANQGVWVKTLAVYPKRERPHPPVDEWMLPEGGVRFEEGARFDDWQHNRDVRRQLLW